MLRLFDTINYIQVAKHFPWQPKWNHMLQIVEQLVFTDEFLLKKNIKKAFLATQQLEFS